MPTPLRLALLLGLALPAAAQAPPPGWVVEETADVVLERVDGASGPETDRTLALFARCAAAVEEALGVPVPPRPRVVIAPTDAAFARRVAAVAGGATHGRALAVAFPARRLVIVRQGGLAEGTSASLERALRHELAHLALGADPGPPMLPSAALGRPADPRGHDAARPQAPGPPIPRWLEEGLAELASGRRLDEAERGTLAARARLGTLPTLDELDRTILEEGPGAADAYTTALAFVGWLGFGDATTLVRALRAPGATLDGAIERTCGRPLAEADAAWRAELAGSGAWWGALLTLSPWSLVGLLALLAIARHLVVRRRLRKALEAEG